MASEKPNRLIIPVLFVGVLMGALDISIVGPAIPSIETTISIDPHAIGWIFSIYILFNLVGISLFAKLSDSYGRRNIYIVALSIFTIGSVVVSLSDNYTILLLGRSIQGFGASGIFPVASAVVGDLYPPEKRGRILGMIGAVFGLAFLVGPILAGTILAYFSWNALFLINIPIGIALIYFSRKVLPHNPDANEQKIDWSGIIFLGVSLGAFTWALSQIDGNNIGASLLSWRIWPFLLLSVLSFVGLLLSEPGVQNPILRTSLFLNRQIRLVALIAVVLGLVQASFVFIPDFAVGQYAVDSSTASFMLVPLVLATAIGSPVFGRLIDKYGSRSIILLGLALTASGFFFLQLSAHGKMYFYGGEALIGLGLSILAGSSLRYIMLNEVGHNDRAVTQGMLTIFISLGQLIGAAIIGVIVASNANSQGYLNVFLYQACLVALIIIPAVRLKSKKQEASLFVK